MDFLVMAQENRFRSGHFHEGSTYQTRRPRGGPEWLLILTVSGAGVHRGRHESITVGHQTAILYPPGVPQWYRTSPDHRSWDLLWAHFATTPRFVDLVNWPHNRDGVRVLNTAAAYPGVRDSLLELVEWQMGASFHRHEFVINALERTLLWCDTVNPQSARAQVDPRVATALDAISRTLAESMSVATLADAAGVSPTRLSHLFKREVGMSVPEYVEMRRMEWARDLLRMTDQPIAEVAAQVGYGDALYFSRRFRRSAGCSPREWRARLSG